MSNEMIERVAKAIAPNCWEQLGRTSDSLANSSRRKASIKHAKAAIQAMREPTEEMLDADSRYGDCAGSRYGNCIVCYYDMIDAALKE